MGAMVEHAQGNIQLYTHQALSSQWVAKLWEGGERGDWGRETRETSGGVGKSRGAEPGNGRKRKT